jgi:hypothetical protein
LYGAGPTAPDKSPGGTTPLLGESACCGRGSDLIGGEREECRCLSSKDCDCDSSVLLMKITYILRGKYLSSFFEKKTESQFFFLTVYS